MTLLSAKWLNKFHINIIVHVVFPENIHTPPQRATEIYSSGGGGGAVQKATISGG